MAPRPLVKWAGGKRWLVDRPYFVIPSYSGSYIEPFFGGGAVFFHHAPTVAILSDTNSRLIGVYSCIKSDWQRVLHLLKQHSVAHSKEYYYAERGRTYEDEFDRAAQFLYLNRACWNGLYRENLQGRFNVPIGTKSNIMLETDDFQGVADLLSNAELICQDFQVSVDASGPGDFVFLDPPYTVAHNQNGFVKYNENIFSWNDQIRLRNAVARALARGSQILMTNADHPSIRHLYDGLLSVRSVERLSVISGSSRGRRTTNELLLSSRVEV